MTEGPRRILHTGSRDFGSSANVACKTEEKDGGGEGTRATADEGTKSCIRKVAENEGLRAGKSKDDIPEDVRGPSGPVKEVILGRSNLLKNTKDTEVEDRREGPRWKRGGPQGMK